MISRRISSSCSAMLFSVSFDSSHSKIGSFYTHKTSFSEGKTMENLRSRVDIKLKSDWEGRQGARMLISRPNFKRFTIFDEDLVAIELKRTNILMNKPIAIGLAILDISKVVMYDFHYNFMKPRYGDNVTLTYTDTDSFIYQVKSECFYTDMNAAYREI